MSDKPTWTRPHVVALLLMALLSLCGGVWLTDPYWASLIVSTAITLVLTMSMNLINGTSGQFTLSHAAFSDLGPTCRRSVRSSWVSHPGFACR